MSDLSQIVCVSIIVILMMFAAAAIIDNKNDRDARTQFVVWACALAILVGQAVW